MKFLKNTLFLFFLAEISFGQGIFDGSINPFAESFMFSVIQKKQEPIRRYLVVISDNDTVNHGAVIKSTFIDEYGDSIAPQVKLFQGNFEEGIKYAKRVNAQVYINSISGPSEGNISIATTYSTYGIQSFMPLGSNGHTELASPSVFTSIITSGAGNADSNMTGYGTGLEFYDFDDDEIVDIVYRSSYSNARVAAKIFKIKTTLNCSWTEARERARYSSSEDDWNKKNGYGIIDVATAISAPRYPIDITMVAVDSNFIISTVNNSDSLDVALYHSLNGVDYTAIDTVKNYTVHYTGDFGILHFYRARAIYAGALSQSIAIFDTSLLTPTIPRPVIGNSAKIYSTGDIVTYDTLYLNRDSKFTSSEIYTCGTDSNGVASFMYSTSTNKAVVINSLRIVEARSGLTLFDNTIPGRKTYAKVRYKIFGVYSKYSPAIEMVNHPLEKPKNVTLTPGDSLVSLNWDLPDTTKNAMIIMHCLDKTYKNFTVLDTLTRGITSYTHRTNDANVKHYYRMGYLELPTKLNTVWIAGMDHLDSATTNAYRTQPVLVLTAQDSSIRITVTGNPLMQSAEIWHSATGDTFSILDTVGNSNSIIHYTGDVSTVHFYKARGIYTTGLSVYSAVVSDTTNPPVQLPDYYQSPPAATDTVYVASWGTAGGSGVDSANAWDIEALYANQASIVPGTAVGFFRGDSIRPALTNPVRVSLIRWNNNRNGTDSNWISFIAVGNPSKTKPYIGTDSCTGYVMCLRTGSVKYISFENLSFGGFIYHKGGDNMAEGLQNIKYLNCDFREIPALDSTRSDWWFANGMGTKAIPDTTVMAPIREISIYGCTFNSIVHKEGTINTCPTKHFRIGYNTFINSREEAIDIAGGDSNLVEYNKIVGTWNANGAAANAMKITSQFRRQTGTTVRGNVILHAGNGHGIETANIDHCSIYNNTIYSHYAAEFGNRDLGGTLAMYGSFKDNYIANNIFNGTVQIYGSWGSELNNLSSGVKYPTSTGEDYNQWSDAADAYTSNDVGAFPDANNEEQDYYGYSLNIPTGVDIFGVEVIVRMNSYSGLSSIIGIELSVDGGVTYSTTGYSVTSASTSFTNTTLGSPTNLWGLTLTSASFTTGNFRLKVKGIAGSDSPTLDYASVNVYYKSKLRGQGYYPVIDSIAYKNTFTHNTFWDIDTTAFRFWKTAAYPSETQTLQYNMQIGTAETTQFQTGWNSKTDGTNDLRNPQLTNAYWTSWQDYGTFTLGAESNEIGAGIYIPEWIKNFNGSTVTNPPNRGAY